MKYLNFSGRRLARVVVLETLYRYDLVKEDPQGILEDISSRENLENSTKDFSKELLSSFISHQEEIDEIIKDTCTNWSIERIASIDRAILRLAVAEIIGIPSVSFRVSISEAVELAKLFSTEESGRFVNGVLDAISAKLGLKESVS